MPSQRTEDPGSAFAHADDLIKGGDSLQAQNSSLRLRVARGVCNEVTFKVVTDRIPLLTC